MRRALVIFFLLAAPAAAQTAEQDDGSALAEVYACAAEADDAARLACYDAAVGRLRAAETSGEVVAIDRAAAETLEREAFGLKMPSLPRIFGRDESEAAQVAENRFEIARVARSASGRGVFTMTNGQVWVQIDGEAPRRARAGALVTIRRAALGSFLMHIDAGGPAVRVRRQE